MEQAAANSAQIRGKDLVGGIKVMPMGLGEHIKKRTSGEFKSEQRGGNLQFSNANKSSSHAVKESKQLTSFMEESSYQGGNQPASSLKTSSQKQASFMQSSAQKTSSMSSSKEFMSSNQMASSQMSSSSMTFSKTLSSSESKSTSMKSSEIAQKELHSDAQSQQFGLEIGQNELKTQIESAITDLEQDRDFVDFDKENQPINLTSPPQTFSPPPSYASQPKQASLDMFSPPPLEPMDPPEVKVTPHLMDQAPPTRNFIQNGFSEFSSTSSKTTTEVQEMSQVTESSIQLAQVMNGGLRQEDSSSIQGSNSSSSLLQKIMTPASVEYDSGSLKRRDPRKMFTDSSFYSAKHHPTVADQVEMAHKLSSAMFSTENKMAKGQQMFLNRAQNAGEDVVDDGPRHDKVPNLKLVMNPEGKIHEWGDLPADQLPDAATLASHAAPNCPNLNSPEINPVAEDLIGGVGKGEQVLPSRHPSQHKNTSSNVASVTCETPTNTFVSAYRRLFDQNRGVFGKECEESPKILETQKQNPKDNQLFKASPVCGSSVLLDKKSPKIKTVVPGNENKTSIGIDNSKKIMIEVKSEKLVRKHFQNTEDLSSPKAPPRKVFINAYSEAAKQATSTQKNNKITAGNQYSNKDNSDKEKPRSSVRRHKSFTEGNNQRIQDNIQQAKKQVKILDNHNTNNSLNSINLNHDKPSDLLQTPTLPTSCVSTPDNTLNNIALKSQVSTTNKNHSKKSQNSLSFTNLPVATAGTFPQINSTSMVSKAKAIFENKENFTKFNDNLNNSYNNNFVPLGKSRTFSSFPTEMDADKEDTGNDSSPSVPQRNSSRKVLATYKSMNSNMNECGTMDIANSNQQRIPMRNFFS